jgi:hypothetical protein
VKRSWPLRVVVAFGAFWWDFLVGDTPELFVVAVFIVALVALAALGLHANSLAIALFPLLVVVGLGWSLARARRR